MADQNLFLQREARVFLQALPGTTDQSDATKIYEIPVLEGFSFSQAGNLSEITISEASSDGFTSRRGRMAYTDNLSPAEFSFSTYARPFKSAGTGTGAADLHSTAAEQMHDCTEVLWAMMCDDHNTTGDIDIPASGQISGIKGVFNGTLQSHPNFNSTDFLQLAKHNLIFQFGEGITVGGVHSPAQTYLVKDAVMNEVTMNFDIDGVCTYEWSGFGTIIKELTAGGTDGPTNANLNNVTPIVNEGIHATNNLIMNRLSTLTIDEVLDPNNIYDGSSSDEYTVTMTGGSITISNNIEYVTPASLNSVSLPLAHFAGTRSVSGSFTCYLNGADDSSAELFADIIESSKFDVTNMFKLQAQIGGAFVGTGSPTEPHIRVTLPACHLEIPNLNVEEVLSLEVNFHGLPNNGSVAFDTTTGTPVATAPTEFAITGGNEIQIDWEGPAPSTSTSYNAGT